MNEHVMGTIRDRLHPETVIPEDLHPEAPQQEHADEESVVSAPEATGLKLVIEDFKEWWQAREDWHRWGMMAGSVVLAAVIVVILFWPLARTTVSTQKVQALNSEVRPVEAKAAISLGQDAAAKSQEGISVLRDAFEQLHQQQLELRGAVNTLAEQTKVNTSDINSVKAAQQVDPKILQRMQEDIDGVKKIMAIPPVKLAPMSALEAPNKTS